LGGGNVKRSNGFSLAEVLIALGLTVGLGAVIFQLFHQNERIFRDQALILEMQQATRMVISTIADDIRLAGQALPSQIGDIVLPGSSTSRLNVRAGFSATESTVTAALPFSVTAGATVDLSVETTSGFSAGREVFLWGPEGWVRATINSVFGSSRTIRITPSEAYPAAVQFTNPPAISPDEAIAIYRDASIDAIRRTTATNTVNAANPSWAPANELATNVTALTFLYYDKQGMPLDPDLPESRSKVAAVESRVTIRCSAALSNGSRPSFSLSIRSRPRNLSFD
jgi:Tfp pilus assembly protein PilW